MSEPFFSPRLALPSQARSRSLMEKICVGKTKFYGDKQQLDLFQARFDLHGVIAQMFHNKIVDEPLQRLFAETGMHAL